jgi:salicylate hydroxylase
MTMEGLAGKQAEIRKFYKGPIVDYPLGCTSWSDQVREFWYRYDIFEQAERAMGFLKEGDVVVPDGGLQWFGDVKVVERGAFAGLV